MGRGEFLLSEIKATLEYLFDDDVVDIDDARLERLAATHGTPTTQDTLASALDDYAGFAALHRKRLDGVGGFQADLIDEAFAVAKALRERSAERVVVAPPDEQRQALGLRNRLMGMLYERIQNVRTAARFVFRNDPATVRKVTSSYQRERVSRARKGKSAPEAQTESAE